MLIDVDHNGASYLRFTPEDARQRGVPDDVVGAALKLEALASVDAFANDARGGLIAATAGRWDEIRIKAAIAADEAGATAEQLAQIDREALVLGFSREAILEHATAQYSEVCRVTLEIAATQAEVAAAINGLADDDVELEAQIAAELELAKASAATAIADAVTRLTAT